MKNNESAYLHATVYSQSVVANAKQIPVDKKRLMLKIKLIKKPIKNQILRINVDKNTDWKNWTLRINAKKNVTTKNQPLIINANKKSDDRKSNSKYRRWHENTDKKNLTLNCNADQNVTAENRTRRINADDKSADWKSELNVK